MQIGVYTDKIAGIRKGRDKIDESILRDIFQLSAEEYNRLNQYIDTYPDWDEADIAEAFLNDFKE